MMYYNYWEAMTYGTHKCIVKEFLIQIQKENACGLSCNFMQEIDVFILFQNVHIDRINVINN